MPELPEAETIARGLRKPLRHRTIRRAQVLRPDLLAGSPRGFTRGMAGSSVLAIGRRGKNVVLDLRAADGEARHLVVNLGMSGRLLHLGVGSGEPPPTHPGVRFALDDGSELVYHDPRRFGRLQLLNPSAFRAWSSGLGPEPLGAAFTPTALGRALSGSGMPIRSWLLDQRKVAGVGNIYANEALYLSGVDPRTPAREIAGDRVRSLHAALRTVLSEAIAARGTTLRDYRTAQGWEGEYAVKLRVYGREGLPCPACGTVVERIVFGARSAFLCPICQPSEYRR